MHYIIDGYNILFNLDFYKETFEEKKDFMIFLFLEKFGKAKFQTTIVFDNKNKIHKDFPTKKNFNNLNIIYSPSNLTADEYILEILSSKKNKKNIILITSDKALSAMAKQFGCKTQTTEEFLKSDKLNKKIKNINNKPEKDNSYDIDRLCEIFEKLVSEHE